MQIRNIILTIVFISFSSVAYAHPHLFIDAENTFSFEGNVVTVEVYWEFDAVYSQTLILDFDSDRNGDFDSAEDAILYDYAFINIAAFNYFTYLLKNGNSIPINDVRDFDAGIREDHLTYRFKFDIPVEEGTEIFLSHFDETNFTAFEIKAVQADSISYEMGHTELEFFSPYGVYLYL